MALTPLPRLHVADNVLPFKLNVTVQLRGKTESQVTCMCDVRSRFSLQAIWEDLSECWDPDSFKYKIAV